MKRAKRSLARRLLLALALSALALGSSGSLAMAKWPPPHCSTAGALIEFHGTDGFTYNDDLVIKRTRAASLCWGRRFASESGRVDFVVSKRVMSWLLINLRLASCRASRRSSSSDPPPTYQPIPPGAPRSTIEYRGRRVRCSASNRARQRAYARAASILAAIVDRRTPPR
jgi:hypothetical protein